MCSLVPVYDSLHAPRGTDDATQPVMSHAGCRFSQCLQHNWIPDILSNVWDWRARTVSTSHITLNPLKRRVGVTNVWYTFCSKQENMQRFDSQKIRQLFPISFFFLLLEQKYSKFHSVHIYFYDNIELFIIRECPPGASPMWSTWCFQWLLISILMTTLQNNRQPIIIL